MATYSFKSVLATIVGPGLALAIGNEAGAAEEGIDIEAAEDINTKTMGADGSGMHSLHADKSGRLTFRLLKTSPLNAPLQLAYNIQTSDPALHCRNTITVTDRNLLDESVSEQVAFSKKPSLKYSKVGQIMVWEFQAIKIGTLLGAVA